MDVTAVFVHAPCLCSVRGVGNQHRGADGHKPRLDVLLLLRRDVHVLLRPLADIRVGNAALRHVSRTVYFLRFLWK